MKVSIITVSYNAAKTILKTIDSIADQSYTNIEFIIIDGGSTDGTLDIIEDNKEKIDIVVSEPDKGVYDAMNKGILRASGDWILFLGADDLLANNNVIETCVQQFSSSHLVYGDVIKVPENEVYDGAFNLYKMIYRNICHQAIFFHKSVFKLKGLYHLDYKVNSDWEFNLRCFQDPKINTKYIPLVVSHFNTEGLSSNTEDVAFEIRKKQLIKLMPIWVRFCYKYRRTSFIKWISGTFLNFDYA
ncbi:glycosyltransferase family 2 protein [Formosa sp. L2A11]|uniref:glycosyltransferase family 2 protein n=1 Tax=Formosa sp. L2A11 TaxID=2686363 RepID=UPI00131B833E|nr:glycosyltransferase family 2 protein [Formosa sp. L2A11]